MSNVMFSKVRFCGSAVEIREYTRPFRCGKREYDVVRKDYTEDEKKVVERYNSSLVRTRSTIYDICSCNVGKYPKFVTLTCKKSILDYDEFLYQMKQFFKNMKRKGHDLRYLWVAEHQTKRGIKEGNAGSYHAHIIIFNDEFIPYQDINDCWNGRTEIRIFNSVRCVNNKETDEKIRNVCAYVVKYITKEMCLEFGKNLYHCSRGLIRPTDIKEIYDEIIDDKNHLCGYEYIDNTESKAYKWLFDHIIVNEHPKSFISNVNGNFVGCQVTKGVIQNE